ncbi:MAG: Holliday junction resolvase RuvX [Alphaproteobacteria bacterium]|nr:Holliday junction resolvase RuvX [Alphaproteobacteria bacterium]MBR5575354.1 Holliday junction resolvase RuvX [Alphaproteobacteria bacterium]
MILPDFKGFPRVGRIIGVDWGARRIGIAVSDETRGFVFVRPVVVIGQKMEHAQVVADIAQQEKVVGIVVGLPLYPDGKESQTTAYVKEFLENLSQKTQLPIVTVEENLTSVSAQEQMGRVRVRDIKERLDSQSARVILENAIAIINRAV